MTSGNHICFCKHCLYFYELVKIFPWAMFPSDGAYLLFFGLGDSLWGRWQASQVKRRAWWGNLHLGNEGAAWNEWGQRQWTLHRIWAVEPQGWSESEAGRSHSVHPETVANTQEEALSAPEILICGLGVSYLYRLEPESNAVVVLVDWLEVRSSSVVLNDHATRLAMIAICSLLIEFSG